MQRLSSLVKLTVIIHTILAAAVVVHSRLTDRTAGVWVPLTLGFGLFGVAGYLLNR